MSSIACVECPELFVPKNSRQKFCSAKCRYRVRDRERFDVCAHCGKDMPRSGKHVPGVSMHQACRYVLREHGTPGAFKKGCKCDTCRESRNAKQREYLPLYRAAYKAKHGEHPSTAYRREYRELHGHNPPNVGSWIDPKVRFGLYERDGWLCLLCDEPIDRAAHWNDNLAPSLDHIAPRSLGGSDDPENLRTAHRSCNSARGVDLDT